MYIADRHLKVPARGDSLGPTLTAIVEKKRVVDSCPQLPMAGRLRHQPSLPRC